MVENEGDIVEWEQQWSLSDVTSNLWNGNGWCGGLFENEWIEWIITLLCTELVEKDEACSPPNWQWYESLP